MCIAKMGKTSKVEMIRREVIKRVQDRNNVVLAAKALTKDLPTSDKTCMARFVGRFLPHPFLPPPH